MPITATELSAIIAAIGALGTSAFGLVEATKAIWGGGVNRFGFGGIQDVVTKLTPPAANNALSQKNILATLKANWFNGTDLGSQKAIAKSLIKLNLSPDNAAVLASITGVDSVSLIAIANNIAIGKALTPAQSDVFGRFDLILTALLDEVYQRGDQYFKNWTKLFAMGFSILLAEFAAYYVHSGNLGEAAKAASGGGRLIEAFVVGLIATPLAPVAKDLSTALASAVNAMQLVNKGGRV